MRLVVWAPSIPKVTLSNTATLSNCRNIPYTLGTASKGKPVRGTTVKVVGMVTIRVAGTIGSQVLPVPAMDRTDAVQRLDGSGSHIDAA